MKILSKICLQLSILANCSDTHLFLFEDQHLKFYIFFSGPIVAALEMGADIVVTGRTADSALALAPCIHKLNWDMSNFDLMASGSLAGHLIECGGQVIKGHGHVLKNRLQSIYENQT
jgi:hypothetical protein